MSIPFLYRKIKKPLFCKQKRGKLLLCTLSCTQNRGRQPVEYRHDFCCEKAVNAVEKKRAQLIQQKAEYNYSNGVDEYDRNEKRCHRIVTQMDIASGNLPDIAFYTVENHNIRRQMVNQPVGKVHFPEKQEEQHRGYQHKDGIISGIHAHKAAFYQGKSKV